jgi:stage V sporulation protein T
MKATGVVRRIDDLGRVVIPKEIRRSLRIHEGEAFEIFIDSTENMVCFKKYSVGEGIYKPYITALLNTLKTKGIICAVYDVDGYKYAGSGLPDRVDLDSVADFTFDLNVMGERIGVLYVKNTEAEQGIIQHSLTMFKELVKAHQID